MTKLEVNGKLREYETLLEALAANGVMTVLAKDGGFEVGEACDNYFSVQLTPEQLRQLGEELIALSGWLSPKPPLGEIVKL